MRTSALVVILALAASPPLAAQLPSSLGTAAGLSGAAVTEARRADAVLWNPALVGVYDGPERTTSLLGLDAAILPGGDGFEAAARLGLVSGRVEEERFGFLAGPMFWGSGSPEAAAQVRWAAVQSRDLAASLDTRFAARAEVPSGLAGELGVRGVEPEVWESGAASRSLASVLSVARGAYLGELPVFGRAWAGVGVKGWWVHEFAIGSFRADLPAAEVYRETVLGNVGGFGVDAGVAGLARGRLWYGLSVSNLYATSFRPGRAPRTRTVEAVFAADGGVELEQTLGPEIRDDDPDADAVARAGALWDETRFPTTLRAGLAWEGRWGTLAAAVSERVGDGGLDPAGVEPRRSLTWHDAARHFRLSYGWGDDRAVVAAAVSVGRCDRRWTAGLRRTSDAAYGLVLDLSLFDWSCNLHAQGR
ncbi:MAG TPA: hypothetical protein VF006_12970 [Longimicrobium sp.]